jgi:hypothetical protein
MPRVRICGADMANCMLVEGDVVTVRAALNPSVLPVRTLVLDLHVSGLGLAVSRLADKRVAALGRVDVPAFRLVLDAGAWPLAGWQLTHNARALSGADTDLGSGASSFQVEVGVEEVLMQDAHGSVLVGSSLDGSQVEEEQIRVSVGYDSGPGELRVRGSVFGVSWVRFARPGLTPRNVAQLAVLVTPALALLKNVAELASALAADQDVVPKIVSSASFSSGRGRSPDSRLHAVESSPELDLSTQLCLPVTSVSLALDVFGAHLYVTDKPVAADVRRALHLSTMLVEPFGVAIQLKTSWPRICAEPDDMDVESNAESVAAAVELITGHKDLGLPPARADTPDSGHLQQTLTLTVPALDVAFDTNNVHFCAKAFGLLQGLAGPLVAAWAALKLSAAASVASPSPASGPKPAPWLCAAMFPWFVLCAAPVSLRDTSVSQARIQLQTPDLSGLRSHGQRLAVSVSNVLVGVGQSIDEGFSTPLLKLLVPQLALRVSANDASWFAGDARASAVLRVEGWAANTKSGAWNSFIEPCVGWLAATDQRTAGGRFAGRRPSAACPRWRASWRITASTSTSPTRSWAASTECSARSA